MPGVLGGVVAGGDKVAPSPNKVLAVACCKLMHDPKGNTAFVCRYPACDKSYASRDAVRKHCRIHHLQWLRTLERVTTHEEEMVEVTLPVRTLKKAGEKGEKKPKAGALTAGDLASFVGLHGVSPDFSGLGGNPFSPSLHALPSADDLFDSLPIDLLNPDELMSGVDALAHEPMTPRTAALTGCVGNPGLISLELAASSLMSDPAGYTPRSSSALAAVQQTLAAELAAIPSAACAACSSGGSFPGGGGGGRALHDALHAPGAPSANTTPATSVVSSSPLYRALGFGAREGKAVSGHDLGSTNPNPNPNPNLYPNPYPYPNPHPHPNQARPRQHLGRGHVALQLHGGLTPRHGPGQHAALRALQSARRLERLALHVVRRSLRHRMLQLAPRLLPHPWGAARERATQPLLHGGGAEHAALVAVRRARLARLQQLHSGQLARVRLQSAGQAAARLDGRAARAAALFGGGRRRHARVGATPRRRWLRAAHAAWWWLGALLTSDCVLFWRPRVHSVPAGRPLLRGARAGRAMEHARVCGGAGSC